jgi:hypothetical protein
MKQSNEIDGWFDYPDAFKFLADSVPDNGVFVEGGAWLGKSSSFLCDYAGDRINIFIVDTWKGSQNELDSSHKLATETDVYDIFLENMGDRKFTPIRKPSLEAIKDFQDESCDVVYIDMEHTYEAVKEDIQAWLPKVKTGGYIAGHDYAGYAPQVQKAVHEFFPKNKINIMNAYTWIVKKEPL